MWQTHARFQNKAELKVVRQYLHKHSAKTVVESSLIIILDA